VIKNMVKNNDGDLVLFFEFAGVVLLLMGFVLLFYCVYRRIHPMSCDVISSPVHYLVLGCICCCVFIYNKYRKKVLI
jgi:hypothetical protein